jgi:lipoprotein-releasing system ATP-binding protein
MTTEGAVLVCENLSKVYQQGNQQLSILRDIDFTVGRAERVSIIGASGSGKTTLLNMLGGLDDPSAGKVSICGRDLGPMNESQRARWRNLHLGFVYQFHHLLDEFSALENIAMPLLIRGVGRRDALREAAALLENVGMPARGEHRPNQLSGGERQRVAIARALVTRPSAVLMDEPTGNLDPQTALTVLNLLDELNAEFHISFVVVTHDDRVAARMDRIMELAGGTLQSYRRETACAD